MTELNKLLAFAFSFFLIVIAFMCNLYLGIYITTVILAFWIFKLLNDKKDE